MLIHYVWAVEWIIFASVIQKVVRTSLHMSRNWLNITKEFFLFLKSKTFWLHLALILLFFLACIWGTAQWLKSYTHHGQQLLLPDYVDQPVESAKQDAEKRSFQIVVSDSAYVVGKEGGIILDQTPPPESTVKEGRKIYVTITKYQAEQFPLADLPVLYGKHYERKKRELKTGYQLDLNVVGQMYDPGPEGHIMLVRYRGDTIITDRERKNSTLIKKGSTLEVVLSEQSGGSVPVPKLVCKTYEEASFLLSSIGLEEGSLEIDATVDQLDRSYVWKQKPAYGSGEQIRMGQAVQLYLTKYRPAECGEGPRRDSLKPGVPDE